MASRTNRQDPPADHASSTAKEMSALRGARKRKRAGSNEDAQRQAPRLETSIKMKRANWAIIMLIGALLLLASGLGCAASPSTLPPTPAAAPGLEPTSTFAPDTTPTRTLAPIPTLTRTELPPRSPTPSGSRSSDIVFYDGTILTMDENQPRAEAVLIRGASIVAVGKNAEILARADSQAIRTDLQGQVLVPGFIDSHQHRIGDRGKIGYTDADPLIQMAIKQGWTTINELYVDEGRLNELRDLDRAGILRLRVNAYLPVMENSSEGKLLGNWFTAYQPGQMVSPHVRVAGLKVFTDFDNATILLWKQNDLNAFLRKQYQNGWQVAVKTVSTRSLEMVLKAFESAVQVEPNMINRRGRLEHALFATPEQITRIKRIGLIPSIQTNNPGQLVGEPDVDALIAREPKGSYAPWRSFVRAGVIVANGSSFPSYYVDEPSGAPFGSPVHLIYQGVTRVGNLGKKPYPWLLDQTITAEDALRALTINAAFAAFEEKVKGSITPGKLADMVILSDDPLRVPAEQINSLQVLMTMIGGKVEWCAPQQNDFCPSASSSQPMPAPETQSASLTATASASLPENPPSNAIDGNIETVWTAGTHPVQWIQIDLGRPRAISVIRLVTSQYPEGETIHQLWGGASADSLRMLYEFKGQTKDNQTLEFQPSAALDGIRHLRVVTTSSPSWVGWREIEIR